MQIVIDPDDLNILIAKDFDPERQTFLPRKAAFMGKGNKFGKI
ncbi:MAG TPA: hypothetical protein VK612_12875 [Pyrinomonadaceae bacterium]|nr:hypothetical protein [Pyrinomonadaceae bacterium]